MRRHLLLSACAGGLCLCFACCSHTVEIQTYVQEVQLAGPVTAPPLHLVTKESRNAVTVTPFLSIQGRRSMSGSVVGNPSVDQNIANPLDTIRHPGGSFSVDRRFGPDNLTWSLPDAAGGLTVDIAWNSSALSFGTTVAAAGGSSLWSWHAGFSLFSVGERWGAYRVEGGVLWQTLDASVSTAVISFERHADGTPVPGTTRVGYYNDRRRDTRFGWYASMLFHTALPNSPVSPFVQLGVVQQTLFRFEPKQRVTTSLTPLLVPVTTVSGGEAETAATIFSITPGIALDPPGSWRVSVGVTLARDLSGSIDSPALLFHPVISFDYTFPR